MVANPKDGFFATLSISSQLTSNYFNWLIMKRIFYVLHPSPIYPVNLQHTSFKQVFSSRVEINVDPDQRAF